jgi:hypothetical protein
MIQHFHNQIPEIHLGPLIPSLQMDGVYKGECGLERGSVLKPYFAYDHINTLPGPCQEFECSHTNEARKHGLH